MSSALQERVSLVPEMEDAELQVGQHVMVIQTKREMSTRGDESRLGALVCEVSTITGTIKSLPAEDNGQLFNFVHIDQGERQPTYVVPVEPATIVERVGLYAVQRQLHFSIIAIENPEQ